MTKFQNYQKSGSTSFVLGLALVYELLIHRPELAVKIYIHPDLKRGDIYQKIMELAKKYQVEVVEAIKPFRIMSPKTNCWAIAEFRKFEAPLNEADKQIVLVNPSNAGNLGTIIRTLVGFGVPNLAIIRPAVDIFDPKVVRASMGSLFQLNFAYFDNFNDYRQPRSNRQFYPFMLQAKQSIGQTQFGAKASLVFGTESSGLDQSYLEIGQSIIIPHTSAIDSLNLPIAVSIAVYELTRGGF